jgi:hypothetical protein
MELVKEGKLLDIIKSIQDFDDEQIVFVKSKDNWHTGSDALVLQFEDDETVRLEIGDLYYFLEVDLIKEVMEVWSQWNNNKKSSLNEICEAVIYYAVNDSYKEPVEKA